MAPRKAFEALRKDNYANWSVSTKNYLLAHHLWDIIETTTEPPTPEDDIVKYEAWTEKNASALNAIGLSCGLEIFFKIKKINSAKVVWDTLANMYAQSEQRVLNSVVNVEQGSSSNGSGTKEDKSLEATGDQIVQLESLSDSSNILEESLSNSSGSDDDENHDLVKYLPLVNAVRSRDGIGYGAEDYGAEGADGR